MPVPTKVRELTIVAESEVLETEATEMVGIKVVVMEQLAKEEVQRDSVVETLASIGIESEATMDMWLANF